MQLPAQATSVESLALSALGALLVIAIGVLLRRSSEISRTLTEHGEALVKITTLLTGANGDNGINAEVKSLREWRHGRRSYDQAVALRLALVERGTPMQGAPFPVEEDAS